MWNSVADGNIVVATVIIDTLGIKDGAIGAIVGAFAAAATRFRMNQLRCTSSVRLCLL